MIESLVEKILCGEKTFPTALVHCTNTDKDVEGDVISMSSKRIVVVIGDDTRLELSRSDTNKPYVGRRGGLEFTVLDADIE